MFQQRRVCNPRHPGPARKPCEMPPALWYGPFVASRCVQSRNARPLPLDLSVLLFQTPPGLRPAPPAARQSRPRRTENQAGRAEAPALAERPDAPDQACAWKNRFLPFACTQIRSSGFSPALDSAMQVHRETCFVAPAHSPVPQDASIASRLPRASDRLAKPPQTRRALLPQARFARRIHKRSPRETTIACRAQADSLRAAAIPPRAHIASAAQGFLPATHAPASIPALRTHLAPHPPALLRFDSCPQKSVRASNAPIGLPDPAPALSRIAPAPLPNLPCSSRLFRGGFLTSCHPAQVRARTAAPRWPRHRTPLRS